MPSGVARADRRPGERRLSPTDTDDFVETYQAGTTINQLAADFGVHRTTVAAHLDHYQIPRDREQTRTTPSVIPWVMRAGHIALVVALADRRTRCVAVPGPWWCGVSGQPCWLPGSM